MSIGRVILFGSAFLFATPVALGAGSGRENGLGRNLLEAFLPAELASRYQSDRCKGNFSSACAVWSARESDPRYVIFKAARKDRLPAAETLMREVIPEPYLPEKFTSVVLPKRSSDDPDTFSIVRPNGNGKVQIVVGDLVLVTWMPDGPGVRTFETVQATFVDPPKPREIREIRTTDQPDLIDEDSSGYLWFSGWGNEIYLLDPSTDVVQGMTGTTATGTPDGMIVDSQDRVWFGAYTGSYLGEVDLFTGLNRYNMPYAPSNPAIPCEAPDGNIWITDHPQNRVTEFNPVEGTFGRSIVMPVPSAWVTQCKADPTGTALWMTWYNAGSLARLDLATSEIQRFQVPCSPAFLAFDYGGSIWASCWNNGNVIQFDPLTLTGTMYSIPSGGQAGGIAVDLSGKIVFAQNTLGRIAVLDPDTALVYAYQLPSRPTFKDSVFVDRAGVIWGPSPYNRLLGKIVP